MRRRNTLASLFVAGLTTIALACAGGANRGETPSATGTATAGPPVAERETPSCDGPVSQDESPVAFRGRVTGSPSEGESGENYRWLKVPVRIEEVEVTKTPVLWEYSYVRGETVDVVLITDRAIDVTLGDCVLVTGDVGLWACGAACDAAGFLAESFVVLR